MSPQRLGLLLRNLVCLCIAGAAGFTLGRADVAAHSPPRSDYAVFAPEHMVPADTGQAWEILEPTDTSPRLYHGGPVILPNPHLLVLDSVSPGSTDTSPPSPPKGR